MRYFAEWRSNKALTVEAADWKPGLFTRESSPVRFVAMLSADDTYHTIRDTVEHEWTGFMARSRTEAVRMAQIMNTTEGWWS